MTYRENIERLKGRQRTNLSKRESNMRNRISFQKEQEQEMLDNIQGATDLVVGKPFDAFTAGYKGQEFREEGQGIFPTLYGKRVKDKHKEGKEAADKDRAERLERMVQHFEQLQDTDTAHHALKRRMLLNGAFYDDADRFTKLSPHAQVGYAQQKLGLYKDSFEDKLKHWMLKNNNKYNFDGREVTPEQVHADNLYPPLIKEALLNEGIRDIQHQNGINGFSEEMLILAGIMDYTDPRTGAFTQGIHNKAKADMMANYRKNYNIEASKKLIMQQFNEFLNGGDRDINRFLTVVGGAVDESNQMLDWSGAWTELENLLVSAMVNDQIDEAELRAIFRQPIPGRPGKTYESEYGHRFRDILTRAQDEAARNTDSDIRAAKQEAKEYEAYVVKENARGGSIWKHRQEHGPLTDADVKKMEEIWRSKGGQNDGETPNFLKAIYTQEEQDQKAIYDNALELWARRNVTGSGGYLTEYDLRNATPATIAKIQKDIPGFSNNNANAINSGEQFRTIGKHGGFEQELTDALNAYKGRAALDKKPFNFAEMYQKLEADYLATYRDLLNAGKLTPEQAHTAALHTVQAKLGHRPRADGSTASIEDQTAYIEQIAKAPDLEALKNSNRYEQRRIDAGKNVIDRIMKARGEGPLPDLNIPLPGAGVDSKDWQDAKKYADSNGREGKISNYYTQLARLYPQFTVEDLVNWQLRAGGHDGLATYSSFNESLKRPGLQNLHRLIGYKPTAASTVQGKIEAGDASVSLKEYSALLEQRLEGGLELQEPAPEIPPFPTSDQPQPPNEDDYKNSRGRFKSGGKAKYQADLKQYESDLLEWQLDNPPELGQGDPSSVWESKVIYEGSSVRNKQAVTVYRRKGDKEWSREIPEGYVAPGESLWSGSYLNSAWNTPGSPYLSPMLKDLSAELYNKIFEDLYNQPTGGIRYSK